MLTDTFFPNMGGAEVAVAELSNALHDLGVYVGLITPSSAKLHTTDKRTPFAFRFPIKYIARRKLAFLSMTKTLLRSKMKPDIIHAHFLYPSGFAALISKPFLNKPCIVTMHGKDIQVDQTIGYGIRLDWRLDLVIKLVLDKVDALVAPSRLVATEAIKAGAAPSKIHIIPNGVDISRFNPKVSGEVIRKRFGIKRKERIVLTISRFHPKKGYAYLVRAIPLIIKENPETKFMFCGRGPDEQNIANSVRSLGLSQNVIFAGFINEREKPMYYAAADIFVVPSLVENAPLTILEALASGKPVVASRTGNITELIRNELSGKLVDPKDTTRLARAIIEYLENPILREVTGIKGREDVVRSYSWNSIAKKTLNLYENLLSFS